MVLLNEDPQRRPAFPLFWASVHWCPLWGTEKTVPWLKAIHGSMVVFCPLLWHKWLLLVIYLILRPCSGKQPSVRTSFLWGDRQHLAMIHFTVWLPGVQGEMADRKSVLDFEVLWRQTWFLIYHRKEMKSQEKLKEASVSVFLPQCILLKLCSRPVLDGGTSQGCGSGCLFESRLCTWLHCVLGNFLIPLYSGF